MTARLGDRIAGGILLLLAIWYWWVADGFEESFGDPVGPAAFPQLVAIPMGLFAAFLIVRPDRDATWIHVPGIFKQGITLAALLAYPALIEPLGFPLSTLVATAVLSRVLGGSWLQATLTGLAVGFGLFVTFDQLLGLSLPFLPTLGG